MTTDYRNLVHRRGTSTTLTVAAGIALTWTGASEQRGMSKRLSAGRTPPTIREKFFWLDSVTFDATGAPSPDVNLTGELRPERNHGQLDH